jgi:hypothetical protein
MKVFTIHNVWQKVDPILADEIASFWLTQQALNDRRQAITRSQQVVFIARGNDGKIAGVSTAYKQMNLQIEHYFYYMRAFVHPDYRDGDIGRAFTRAIVAFFELLYVTGIDREVVGVFMEIENHFFQNYRRDAILQEAGFVYIGKNERGAHLRLRYFEGAQI